MTTDDSPRPEWGLIDMLVAAAALGLTLLLIGLLAQGCSPRVVETIHYQHDTTYVERLKVDSIFYRDSIYIKDHGDTVWIYKEQWRDRWHFQRDTIDRVRVDSVTVEREKIVEVEKPLSKWQSLKIRAFPWLLGLLSAAGLWTFRKPILKLLKI